MRHIRGSLTFLGSVFPKSSAPPWLDCLDYAARVEYLGIGIDGNRNVGFPIEGVKLSEAIVKTVACEASRSSSKNMQNYVKKLAKACQMYGGRECAMLKIKKMCNRGAER